jgi:hypothetical protein
MNIQSTTARDAGFEARLDRLAELAIRVGLNLQPGQDLLLTAPAEALPLVRRLAEHAYKAGANLVTPFLSDPEVTLARFRHARDESFDRAAGWLYEGMGRAFDENTARLAVVGEDPMLLAEQDPAKAAAPTAPCRSPTAPRASASRPSPSTGPSSPGPVRPGPVASSPTSPSTRRRPASPTRSSPPRALTAPTPSPPGRRTTATSTPAATG